MDLDLEEVCLEVRAHGGAGNADAQRRKRVEARNVLRGLRDSFLRTLLGGNCCCRTRCEPAPNSSRFDAETHEAREPKHNSNGDVLNLLGGVGVARVRTEALHPGVGNTIKEDDEGLDELSGGVPAMVLGSAVPRPAKIGKRP